MKPKTLTWWVGWIVLYPVRLILLIGLVVLVFAAVPSLFYPVVDTHPEHNPDNWNL